MINLKYIFIFYLMIGVDVRADSLLKVPSNELWGKASQGVDVQLNLVSPSVNSGATPAKQLKDVTVRIVIRNNSSTEVAFVYDMSKGGPLDLISSDPEGKAINLSIHPPDKGILRVEGALLQIKPGEKREFEQTISFKALSLAETRQLLGTLTFFDYVGKEPWKGPKFTVWSNPIALDLKY